MLFGILMYFGVLQHTSAPQLNSTLLSMQTGKALLLSPSETSSEKSRILLGCVLEYAVSTWIQFISGLNVRIILDPNLNYLPRSPKFQFAPCPNFQLVPNKVTTCSNVNFWGQHQHVALCRRDLILAVQPGVRCKRRWWTCNINNIQ